MSTEVPGNPEFNLICLLNIDVKKKERLSEKIACLH